MTRCLPIAIRLALQCTILSTGAVSSLIAADPVVVSVVFSDSPLFWVGLNPNGRLIAVSVDLRNQAIGSWRERAATQEELVQLTAAIERDGLMRLSNSYSGPKELAVRAPGLPLTRITLWQGTNTHEISVAGIDYAPGPLREFVGKFRQLAISGAEAKPAAAARCISLDRPYGDPGQTYASVIKTRGKQFIEIPAGRIESAPGAIKEAVTKAGLFVPLQDGDVRWLSDLGGWEKNSLYLAVGQAHYQFDLWRGSNISLQLPSTRSSPDSIKKP